MRCMLATPAPKARWWLCRQGAIDVADINANPSSDVCPIMSITTDKFTTGTSTNVAGKQHWCVWTVLQHSARIAQHEAGVQHAHDEQVQQRDSRREGHIHLVLARGPTAH